MRFLIIFLTIDAIIGLISSVTYICIKKSTNKMIDDFVEELKQTEFNKKQ